MEVEVVARCLAGEAGIKPVADHAAILWVLHRLADKRGQSVEHTARRHCNAATSAKGIARVDADRMRYPQAWEALVQFVEAFDVETTPDPCRGAVTWAGPVTDARHIAAVEASGRLVRARCSGPTMNVFFREARR